MANRIQLRRGGSQEWRNANPVLAQGEIGIDLDSGRIKIGDGSTAWNSLAYERPVESVANTANSLVQRDADGNFAAGVVTATLIGNASTASRLSNIRQIQLTQDVVASGVFDGSANLNLAAQLNIVTSLPHYDGTTTSTGTYTKVVVDAKGRITNASSPTTIQAYGLDTSIEGTGAQPYDNDLEAVSNLTTTGIAIRSGDGNWTTRSILSTAGQIVVTNGSGTGGNPQIDLATTTVVSGNYNTENLNSVSANGPLGEPYGTQTVNTVKFTVDNRGRLQSATNVPIATATEGSKYPAYGAGTTYSRYDIIETGNNVYQAITNISAGGGAPTHTDSSDTGGWRFLAAAAIEQKGLASFAQEDFDVDNNGHVTIAAKAVDNTQLQNNRISFADGNTKEDFELDQELTATTGYRGFNYLNYVTVNDTSGSLLFTANNTANSGSGGVDINVDTNISGANIILDRPGTSPLQTIERTAGSLKIFHNVNSATDRTLDIVSTNAGAGSATINITADNDIVISSTTGTNYVKAEDIWFRANTITSDNSTIIIDPATEGDNTGTVQIKGNLQIDGTTTTVNSTTVTIDDPIITLGGDQTPTVDDNKDRGVEFKYYDTQARLGFFGWDDSYATLAGTTGGYRFLYNATNTSEVFSGTDAGIIGGNLALTSNVGSSGVTNGTLVVTGGTGISENLNVGGRQNLAGDFNINSGKFTVASSTGDTVIARDLNVNRDTDLDGTLNVDGNATFQTNVTINADNALFDIQTNAGVSKFSVDTDNGNTVIQGTVDVTDNVTLNKNVTLVGSNTAATEYFKIKNGSSVDKFTVDSSSGNTLIEGTLTNTGAVDLNSTLNVAGLIRFESIDVPTVVQNGSTGLYEIQSGDYGSFRFDGGGYVEGVALFNDDIYCNGALIVKDTGDTGVASTVSNLSVRYKSTLGSGAGITDNASYNPSYATHTSSTLVVRSGAGIYRSLHVGATLSGDGFFVGKKNSGDTAKFSVIGATGNTSIVGTLDVTGNVTFTNNLTVNGSLTTIGNANTDILTVNADATLTDNLTVNQAVDFDSTLNVDGAVDFNSTLVVDDNTTFNRNVTLVGSNTAATEYFRVNNASNATKFEVDSASGNTSIAGTLGVTGATSITSTLGVGGVTSLTNSADQTLTGTYAADGAVRVTGGVGVAKNLAVGGNMRVYGDFEISGSTTQSGNTGFSGRVTISNTSDITSWTDSTVALSTTGGFRASLNAYIGGDFYIWDAVNSRAAFFVDNSTGNATLHNSLTVGGNLIVNGTTTTVNSTTVTIDDPIFTLGGDTAPTSDDNKDRGIEFRYYTGGAARVGFFGYDDSANEFAFLTAATNTSEVFTGTDGNLRAGSLRITGTGTTLDVDANANIDGTLTVAGQAAFTNTTGSPFTVGTNTNKVTNLNADLLDGYSTASTSTANTVVIRDASQNFAANIITVNSGTGASAGIQGNALTADTLKTTRNIAISGVVSGNVNFNGSADVTITTTYVDADITALAAMAGTGLVTRTAANTYAQRTIVASPATGSGITVSNGDGVSGNPTINILSSSSNSANNLVLRGASGEFAAGAITGTSLTSSGTLSVTGITTLSGALNANGGIAVDTNAFTVADVTGNTSIAGTLSVTGVTTLTGALNANGGITVDTSNFTVDGTTGAVSTASTLNASGATTLGSTLGVTGITTLTGLLNANGGIAVGTNKFTVASATGNTLVAGTLSVTGTSTFTGALTATGGVVGNASTATTLQTARTIGISGDGTGTATSFNGSANITIPFTLANSGVTAGTYTKVTVNAKGLVTTGANATTTDISEGTNQYYTNARADARVALETGVNLDLSNQTTTDLNEGTNLYYTEARVQTKLDDAFAQLKAMLDNLAASTTLTLNLSGDPTPGVVVSLGSITDGGGGGFTNGTNVATTSDGSGTGLTVNTTTVGGVITAVALNQAGSGYEISDTITIANPTAGGVITFNFATLSAGTGYTTATNLATTTTGSGTGLRVNITATGGEITGVTVNAAGTGYEPGDTITIVQAGASDGTIDVSTVRTDATFTLADITTMEVGATLTGATSGTTGVITSIGATSVTVDTVDGFFKVGETVGANDVTTLTITSFG